MFKKIFNLKIGILAFGISFIFCFFIGIFYNPPITTKLFNQDHRFYINRGYPIAWAGVSEANKNVDFPLIKMPFLTKEINMYEANGQRITTDGAKWTKIIDLRVFIPLFIITFTIFYLITFFIIIASEKNKFLGGYHYS